MRPRPRWSIKNKTNAISFNCSVKDCSRRSPRRRGRRRERVLLRFHLIVGRIELEPGARRHDLVRKVFDVAKQFILQESPVGRVDDAPRFDEVGGEQAHLNLRV